ncbi:MAG: hypothetical protein AVDCRST_MAG71-1526 [uncultured Lysobacter sp.]|uniref:Uncharacterized protein n=1 Tax=uncultured Lysobacter sp. TaxID=271060 RepID=A0A6J4L9L2_9GAMM|nr:MAG: hypothetical protein AVDCRST_MAG71-1526 [uncultured Lysobacter sp.]
MPLRLARDDATRRGARAGVAQTGSTGMKLQSTSLGLQAGLVAITTEASAR